MPSKQDDQAHKQASVKSHKQQGELLPHDPPPPRPQLNKLALFCAHLTHVVRLVVLVIIAGYTASMLWRPIEPGWVGLLTALFSLFAVLDSRINRH